MKTVLRCPYYALAMRRRSTSLRNASTSGLPAAGTGMTRGVVVTAPLQQPVQPEMYTGPLHTEQLLQTYVEHEQLLQYEEE